MVPEVWEGCPKFRKGTRNLGRVPEVWAGCPKFGKGAPSLDRVPEVRACFPMIAGIIIKFNNLKPAHAKSLYFMFITTRQANIIGYCLLTSTVCGNFDL